MTDTTYPLYTLVIHLSLLVLLLLTGCVTQPTGTLDISDRNINSKMTTTDRNKLITKLQTEGENVRVSQEFEEDLKKLSSADNRKLCDTYCENENFSKCNSCLDTYLERDDIQTVSSRTCLAPGSISQRSITADFHHIIDYYEKRARMCLFFAEYTCAQKHVDEYANIIQKLERCSSTKESHHYIQAAEIFALIGNKTGNGQSNRTKAEHYLNTAQQIAKNSKDRKSKIVSEINKAQITVHIANKEYEKALIILEDPKDYLNKTYGARLGENLNKRSNIIAGTMGVVGIIGSLGGLSNRDTALLMGATGGVAVAATMLEEAVADIENLPYRNFQIAKCNYELGHYQKAKITYEKLLNATLKKDDKFNLEVAYQDLGYIYSLEGNHTLAVEYLTKAIDLIERYRSSLNTDADKMGFVTTARLQVYSSLIDSLVELQRLGDALEYAERAKSRALVDILAGKKSFGTQSMQAQSAKDLLMYQMQQEMVARTERSSISTRSLPDNVLVEKIQRTNPAMASLVTVSSLEYSTIQSFLKADETLLEFYGEGSNYYAFVVTGQGIHMAKLEADNLHEKVSLFLQALQTGDPRYNGEISDYREPSKALYKSLIEPIRKHITTEKLTVVPHGPLHHLPFNALLDEDSFLIEDFSIRMLPSASVLEFLKESSSRNGEILILSNPYVDNYISASDISNTKREGDEIAKFNPQSQHLTGKQATETIVEKYGSIPAILHIGSHGQFFPDTPLKSRLLLTQDNENDGSLTVDDLYHMELNNYLVTLSACETGLGKGNNGDDVIGLIRGFLFAGAESIINTLWKVDDVVTADIMIDFYAFLRDHSKQDSLQRALLKQVRYGNNHPYFWAPFQITGASGLEASKITITDTDASSLVEKRKLADYRALGRRNAHPLLASYIPPAPKTKKLYNQSGSRGISLQPKEILPPQTPTPTLEVSTELQTSSNSIPLKSLSDITTELVDNKNYHTTSNTIEEVIEVSEKLPTKTIDEPQQDLILHKTSLEDQTTENINDETAISSSVERQEQQAQQNKAEVQKFSSENKSPNHTPVEQEALIHELSNAQPGESKTLQVRKTSKVEIFLNVERTNDTTFTTTTEKISIAIYLGPDSSYSYINLIVSDISRGVHMNEIPVLLAPGSKYNVSSLRRPMQGWTEGVYEVVAMDKDRSVIARKEFNILK